MFQQESKPLRPRNGRSPGNCGQLFRIDPLGEFGEDRRHLIKTAGMPRVSHKVERRRLRRRHKDRAPRRVEGLNRHVPKALARDESHAHGPALDRPAVPCKKHLEFLRALMGSTVILCGRQKFFEGATRFLPGKTLDKLRLI
jgi:hypothetical protein